MAEKQKPQPRLIGTVTTSRHGMGCDYLNVDFHATYVGDDDRLKNFVAESFSAGSLGTVFDGLTIRAQGVLFPGRTEDEAVYGWSTEYKDLYIARLERLEVCVKTLRRVRRGLERLESQLGYATTFGQYVARVANVLGIREFGFLRDDAPRHSLGDPGEYIWYGAASLSDGIEYRVQKARKDAGWKEEVPA